MDRFAFLSSTTLSICENVWIQEGCTYKVYSVKSAYTLLLQKSPPSYFCTPLELYVLDKQLKSGVCTKVIAFAWHLLNSLPSWANLFWKGIIPNMQSTQCTLCVGHEKIETCLFLRWEFSTRLQYSVSKWSGLCWHYHLIYLPYSPLFVVVSF